MVEPPKRRRVEMRVLDEEQTRLFLAEAKRSSSHYRLFLAAVLTGMRQGELLGLRWSDINLTIGTISVQQTLYRLGKRVIVKEAKSARSRRVVDLPPMLVEELRRHREEQKERRGALGPRYADGELVFCQRDGKPLHGHNLNRRDLRRLLEERRTPAYQVP